MYEMGRNKRKTQRDGRKATGGKLHASRTRTYGVRGRDERAKYMVGGANDGGARIRTMQR
jgi:hypothetical protein